ncbi:hypothetical protein L9F63_022853 [Diploptera punctata]|uniref:DNA polymerase n=1 Tax=Diploptera punctata TaxID=6984 RepID=A0AAD7ZMI6_DIPPU|nr:hypothetical protein L9F63_022853 [Diploptera punctata]
MSKKDHSDKDKNIFKNYFIHVLPVELGKKRMTLFKTQILNKGGIFVDKLSASNITHIVIEDSVLLDSKRCMKLLNGVDLDGLKVVSTLWLSKCLKESSCVDTKDYEMHFPEKEECFVRMDGKGSSTDSDKKRSNNNCSIDEDGKNAKFVVEYSPPKKLKSVELEKYACTQSSNKGGIGMDYNCQVIAELQKLADAFRSNGDQWRAHGYVKAISAIRAYGSEIKTFEEAQSISGIGAKMAAKICEILEMGTLRKVGEICNNEKNQVMELFTKVWGVGPATAQNWSINGFRTLEDLKTKAHLTNQQKIGLKHFDDIQDRMIREEVEEIGTMVKKAALDIEPRLKVELCGSYRRGKVTCGDVDVLITKPDDICIEILIQIVGQLRETGFITDDLVKIEVNKTHKKYLGLCRLPGANQRYRRLDIFVVPQSEYATALMHYTGSALFNRSIRLLATNKGMSLSEHSLTAGIVREGKDILNDGYILPTPTEESIFTQLELQYRPPEERDH